MGNAAGDVGAAGDQVTPAGTLDATATDVTNSAVGDARAAGAIGKASDAGHRHGREAFATPAGSAVGDVAAAGAATTVPRSDHVHGRESFGGAPPIVGGAAAGVATTPSRSDHVHASLAGGPLTSVTAINNQQTLTTGGVTYAAPALASGHVYRIRATGNYVSANSATGRSAQVSAFWGSTQLATSPGTSAVVLTATAQTTNWELEFLLAGTSTTAIWSTGYFTNRIASATLVDMGIVTPQSTTVTSGAQTLDLRFATSASVPGDSWNVRQVTIERLQ